MILPVCEFCGTEPLKDNNEFCPDCEKEVNLGKGIKVWKAQYEEFENEEMRVKDLIRLLENINPEHIVKLEIEGMICNIYKIILCEKGILIK